MILKVHSWSALAVWKLGKHYAAIISPFVMDSVCFGLHPRNVEIAFGRSPKSNSFPDQPISVCWSLDI